MPTAGRETRAHAPGKLILSGEHSVLYGAPALAMAVARYTEVWFKPQGPGAGLKTAFGNLSGGADYPLKLLSQFKTTLDARFDQFARGELEVKDILSRPDDLAVYTLASMLQDAPGGAAELPGFGARGGLPAPGQLGSRSDLPIGAGMGSSAAVVAAVTVLFETLLERPKTPEARAERVRFCERLKHGRAGPIDAATVVRGGLVQAGEGGIETPVLPADHGLAAGRGWYWVLHGLPESDTGECVAAVRETHGSDTGLWAEFDKVTRALIAALTSGADPDGAITENARLLDRIGVVPDPARAFVAEVEAMGGAAKICGAGSIRGTGGGMILVHLDDPGAMDRLMADHPGKPWAPLRMAQAGAAAGAAP